MKKEDKQKIIKSYNESLEKYGYDPRSLQWFKGRQPIRFKVLSEIDGLNNCSILDVGCGFGDLCNFLIKKGLNIKYTGYDINPKFIKIAREVYPDVCFKVKDIEEEDIKEKFDWVFVSGVFNKKISDSKLWVQSMLRKMFELCSKGVAADFMSSYVDYEVNGTYYVQPEEILDFCKTLSRRVVLRHDYMPYEFCVYIYKDEKVSKRNVFENFV